MIPLGSGKLSICFLSLPLFSFSLYNSLSYRIPSSLRIQGQRTDPPSSAVELQIDFIGIEVFYDVCGDGLRGKRYLA